MRKGKRKRKEDRGKTSWEILPLQLSRQNLNRHEKKRKKKGEKKKRERVFE